MNFIRTIFISLFLISNNNLLGSDTPTSPRATSQNPTLPSVLEATPDLDPMTSLEVFKSTHGLGLRAKVTIPKDSNLGAYTGLKTTEAEYTKVELYRSHLNNILKKYLGNWYPQTNFIYPSQRYYFDLKRGSTSVVINGNPNETLKAIAKKHLQGDLLSSEDVEYLKTVHFPWKKKGRVKFPQMPSLLSFVNTNGENEEANVAAVQDLKKNTYFVSFLATKEIKAGDEILVDYGAAYKKLLFSGASSVIGPHHHILLDLIDQGILKYHKSLTACVIFIPKKGFKIKGEYVDLLERILFEIIHTTRNPEVQNLLNTTDLKRIKTRKDLKTHCLRIAPNDSLQEGEADKKQSPHSVTATFNFEATCLSSFSSSSCCPNRLNCTFTHEKSSSSASGQVTPYSRRSLDSKVEKAFCNYEKIFGGFVNWTCPLPSCQKSKCNRKELFSHFLRRHSDMTDLKLILARQEKSSKRRRRKKTHRNFLSIDTRTITSPQFKSPKTSPKRPLNPTEKVETNTKRAKSREIKNSKARSKKPEYNATFDHTEEIKSFKSKNDINQHPLDFYKETYGFPAGYYCPATGCKRPNRISFEDLKKHWTRNHSNLVVPNPTKSKRRSQ